MTDLQDNLAWIIGSIATAIAMAIGWFISSGAVLNLLFLLVGVGITYFVNVRTQKRAWKRENALTMRDRVYGPIFREISVILEDVESVQRPDWTATQKLDETMGNYLFYKIEQNLKNKLYALLDRYEKYQKIYSATEKKVLEVIRNAVIKEHKIPIQSGSSQVILRLEIEGLMVDSIALEQTLMQRVSPLEFVERVKKEFGEGVTIDVTIGGTKKNLTDFEGLYIATLNILEKETLFTEELKQRKALLKKLDAFLEEIKVFIDLD